MNILFADCGSTKCDWALVDTYSGKLLKSIQTKGLNLAISDDEAIGDFVGELPAIADIDSIEFYGAGAKIKVENDNRLASLLTTRYGSSVAVDTDLVGAARALFGQSSGVACILGTGSNSGVYDGKSIVANTPPLGYILGDEGSGAALGKRLANAVFKGLLPGELIRKFFSAFPISKGELIENVYRKPGGNFYLARFAKFLSANIREPEIARLVEDEFRAFFVRNIEPYFAGEAAGLKSGDLKIGFVGSIAYHFAPLLRKVTGEFIPESDALEFFILHSPIDGLIRRSIS